MLMSFRGRGIEHLMLFVVRATTYRDMLSARGRGLSQTSQVAEQGADYASACKAYGLTQQEMPQVVKEGEVAVKQTELQAAKAEAVSIADGVVSLAVGVCTNGNFTAETKSWAPVELKPENVKVENGKIVISIPVDSQSGFMILQSGDAKVGAGKAD